MYAIVDATAGARRARGPAAALCKASRSASGTYNALPPHNAHVLSRTAASGAQEGAVDAADDWATSTATATAASEAAGTTAEHSGDGFFSFDLQPAHTRNMMRERDGWRVERDGHEKRRKKHQTQISDLTLKGREAKKKWEAAEKVAKTLAAELDRMSDALQHAHAELQAERQSSEALRRCVGELTEEVERLRARSLPVLRDSALLRQVRCAEARVGELERQLRLGAGGGGGGGGRGVCGSALDDGSSGGDDGYSPLLTSGFMGQFSVVAPLGCRAGLRQPINGAEWLRAPPPDWEASCR